MATVNSVRTTKYESNGASGEEEEHLFWRDHSRLVITPTAAPSVLGLFGFSAATLIVAGNIAGWYGPATHSGVYFAPFALVFGGIAQFLAGMWAFKARDALATAMHGMWGSFWIAYGIFWLMVGGKALTLPAGATHYFVSYGMWFVMLGLLTMIGAFAAIGKNLALFSTLGLLAAGSDLLAVGLLSGNTTFAVAAGWVLVASVGAAVYTASALLLAESYGRTILPMLEFNKKANIPFRHPKQPIEYSGGMPGSRIGQ
ncbi:MAG: acetate uptake transporter [Acidimicrobiales bacterium]